MDGKIGEREAARAALAAARDEGRTALGEAEAKAVLASFGIAVPRGRVLPPVPPAGFGAGLTPPFALKIATRGVLHKTELGGVRLGLADEGAVRAAIAEIGPRIRQAGHAIDGWLLEEMAPKGVEIVVGALNDRRFGPVVMCGLGGILVELLEDVAFAICPLDRIDCREMVGSLRGRALLQGWRGAPAASLAALEDVLLRVGGAGGLLETLGADLAELDINPLIVSAEGAVAADARIVPCASFRAHRSSEGPRADDDALEAFSPLFAPRSIAVVGASANPPGGLANILLRRLRADGFAGEVHVVHPSAAEIEGFPAYRSLAALPEPVDYAYVAVAAARTPELFAGAEGRVRFVQVVSSGFAEAGEPELQQALAAAVRRCGARLIGPNCLGIHMPRARLSFIERVSFVPGPVGVLCQSGGLGIDVLRRGERRGLRFSGLVTLGNCADLGAGDLLEFLVADRETRVIGLYLEDLPDARRVFAILREGRGEKPVVLLKGGRTAAGQRASASHTGALAQDDRLWQALSRQTGAVLVDTLDAFVDALLLFQQERARDAAPTSRVVLFGNGGGTSVLATDAFSRAGFEVPPLSEATRARLDAIGLAAGSSLGNPVDTPAVTLRRDEGKIARPILEALAGEPGIGAVVVHLNMTAILRYQNPAIVPNLIESAIAVRAEQGTASHVLLVLRSDGETQAETLKQQYREAAVSRGIAVYDEPADAAIALRALADHERFRASRSLGDEP